MRGTNSKNEKNLPKKYFFRTEKGWNGSETLEPSKNTVHTKFQLSRLICPFSMSKRGETTTSLLIDFIGVNFLMYCTIFDFLSICLEKGNLRVFGSSAPPPPNRGTTEFWLKFIITHITSNPPSNYVSPLNELERFWSISSRVNDFSAWKKIKEK